MAKQKKTPELSDRERRRQRRIRAQILSYAAMALLLICLAAGLFLAGKYATDWIADKRQEEAFAREMAALSETESESEETEETETQESEADYTQEDLLDEMVDASIASMPLEDWVAGLFLTTPEALTGTDRVTKAGSGTEQALAEYPVGGIVYAASNIQSEEQFAKMLTDTIPKSKYPLFLILEEQTDALPQELSNYGINMEFADRSEEGTGSFRTVTLPSLLGNAAEEGLTTVELEESEDLAKACLEAWEGGAALLYVKQDFPEAYEGMLEAISGDAALEEKAKETLETIYRVKYRNRLEE